MRRKSAPPDASRVQLRQQIDTNLEKVFLEITVRLMQFIPLAQNEDFSLEHAQAFMEKAEKQKRNCKPIKTKLRALSTGLYIEHGSWWPEDGKAHFISYAQIRKYITFKSKLQVLLLGIIHYDERRRAFMYIVTKGPIDTKSLCKVIESADRQ
ncbi:hypothetical protein Ciccas_009415, partial [Cichlidogyrus casuarinus]